MSTESARPEDLRMDMSAVLGAILARGLRIALVTVLLLMATYTILLFVPKMYESSAGLLVEERSNALARTAGEQAASQPSIPVEAMMSSQIELIKSRDTLMNVIDSENLREEPELGSAGFSPIGAIKQLFGSKPDTSSIDQRVLGNLNDRLTVVRERDSAVISVLVRAEDPDLAARIANAIANAHVRRRSELSLSDTAVASDWLSQEIERLRVKVQESESAVAEYRVANDLFAGANNASIREQQLSAIAAQITAAQERKNAAQSRANLIRGLLDAGQPINGVEDVRASVVIQQLSQSLATLQGELAQSSSTLLSNHPTIKALRAQIAEIVEQIALEGRRVAEALEAEAQIEADLEASLNQELERAKTTVSTATRDTVTLAGLEREAKAQRDLLESYLLKYSDAMSRTDASSALPDVRVVTLAAPAVRPASPKTTLILGAVGFVSLALQIGGILFGELMSGRALTERRPLGSESVPEPAVATAWVADARNAPWNDDGEFALEQPASAEQSLQAAADDLHTAAVADLESDPAMASWSAPAGHDETEPAVEEVVEALLAPAPPEQAIEQLADSSVLLADNDAEPQFDGAEMAAAPTADAASESWPEPVAMAEPETHESEGRELSNLSADIALGRVRVVLLAALIDDADCAAVSASLVADALHRGLSVVRVDAVGGEPSVDPGLTDLSAELASFGDVVHKVRDGLAEVPWGQQPAIEHRSGRPLTLLEALSDIYEVVIVATGRIGPDSVLPVFAGMDCRLVLVEGEGTTPGLIAAAIDDAAALGFDVSQLVTPPPLRSEVA